MVLMILILILGVNISVLLYLAWNTENRFEKIKEEIKSEMKKELVSGGRLDDR